MLSVFCASVYFKVRPRSLCAKAVYDVGAELLSMLRYDVLLYSTKEGCAINLRIFPGGMRSTCEFRIK